MITLRIVELESGCFAIQKKTGFCCWGFCSLTENYVWRTPDSINRYCMAKTLAEAEAALIRVCEEIKMERKKPPRVVRVIKTVRI